MRILTKCREASTPDGRGFVVDSVVQAGSWPQCGKLLDVGLLVLTGGANAPKPSSPCCSTAPVCASSASSGRGAGSASSSASRAEPGRAGHTLLPS